MAENSDEKVKRGSSSASSDAEKSAGKEASADKRGEEGKEPEPRDTASGPQDQEPGTLRPSSGQARNQEPAAGEAAESGAGGEAPQDISPHPFEELLDEYPLRDPSEDPVWSVRIIKGWLYFLAFNFAWIALFLILGIFYE